MTDKAKNNWHDNAFFGIHYDLHAKKDDVALGSELSVEHLLERWKDIKPDWVQCDCKGHPGYTSWPTETGSPSPGIVKDSLRIHREASKKTGIKLGMHYSGVFELKAIELHPDWAALDPDGKPSERSVCVLSPYLNELMIPQMLEIIHKYNVDGFWVDGDNWAAVPCWCDRCRKEFIKRTGIDAVPLKKEDANWNEWLAFHRSLFVEYVTAYAAAIHKAKPDCLACSNWMYTMRQPESIQAPVDYLSGDYSPNWGAQRAALEGRFLDSRSLSWDLMVWGKTRNHFRKETHYELKSEEHLCQEVSEVIALGGALMVYIIPQRTGWLNEWEHKTVAAAAEFARERKEFCFQSKSVSDAAIGHLATHYYSLNQPLFNFDEAHHPVEGAMDLLLENHFSTDIIPRDRIKEQIYDYSLFALPEQKYFDDELIQTLEDYVSKGGIVLASGEHLSKDYPELFGCNPDGDLIKFPHAIETDGKAFHLYGEWQPVKPGKDVETLVCALKDLEPEKDKTDKVIATKRKLGKGAFVALHGAIFKQYFLEHSLLARAFMKSLLDNLKIDKLVETDAPSRLEIINRTKNGRIIINLINRGVPDTFAENRFVAAKIEPIKNVRLSVKLGNKPKSVSIVPSGKKLDYEYKNGRLEINLPQVHIHSVIAIK